MLDYKLRESQQLVFTEVPDIPLLPAPKPIPFDDTTYNYGSMDTIDRDDFLELESPLDKESKDLERAEEFNKTIIKELILALIKHFATEQGEDFDIGIFDEIVGANINEIINYRRDGNWIGMFVIIDRISNGFLKLKLSLAEALMPKGDVLQELINTQLSKLNTFNLVDHSDRQSDQENDSFLNDLAIEFEKNATNGVAIVEDITSINDATKSNKAYLVHVSGTFIRTVAETLALCNGKIELFKLNLTKTITDKKLLKTILVIAKYLEILGNNYVNHDYTNSRTSEVAKLPETSQLNLKLIESIILSHEFFGDDIISIPVSGTMSDNLSKPVIAGGIRYSFSRLDTLSRRTVGSNRLKETYDLIANGGSELDLLMSFLTDEVTTLDSKTIALLKEVWGIDLQDKFDEHGIKPEYAKYYNKIRAFIREILVSNDTLIRKVSPFLRMETPINSPMLDPRFQVFNKIDFSETLEGEPGRLVKLEDKELRHRIFPELEGLGTGIEFHITKFIRKVNEIVNTKNGVPMTTAFIQPNPGLLAMTNIGLSGMVPSTNGNYVLINTLVKPTSETKSITAGMSGYFSSPVGKVLCISINWLREQTMRLLEQGAINEIKPYLDHIMRELGKTTIDYDVVIKFWESPAEDLIKIHKAIELVAEI